jgi:hypothetical protein
MGTGEDFLRLLSQNGQRGAGRRVGQDWQLRRAQYFQYFHYFQERDETTFQPRP